MVIGTSARLARIASHGALSGVRCGVSVTIGLLPQGKVKSSHSGSCGGGHGPCHLKSPRLSSVGRDSACWRTIVYY
jgi:hypothetical protein